MPKQKSKSHTKKRHIIIIALTVLVSVVLLGIMGKLVSDDVARRQVLASQVSTLNQTRTDMTVLYDLSGGANGSLAVSSSPPENRCSETSSKGTTKLYVCGTRAKIVYLGASEQSFRALSESLQKSVPDAFKIKKVYSISESSLYNALTLQVDMQHEVTGIDCSINGYLYKDKEAFTSEPNEIQYTFDCNLNTTKPLFPLES